MTEAATGFLSRWTQRKNDTLRGKPLTEPVPSVPLPVVAPVASATVGEAKVDVEEALPTLSLEDVKLLTKDSDFKPFMAHNVGPDVRNAAMKKLFEDPHFNIMDGLDIYIDDYSISDPIPESMLRQMAGAKFLNLFDEKEDSDQKDNLLDEAAIANERPETLAGADQLEAMPLHQEPAQSAPYSAGAEITPHSPTDLTSTFVASQENHANPYLRLQPDNAPSNPEAGRDS